MHMHMHAHTHAYKHAHASTYAGTTCLFTNTRTHTCPVTVLCMYACISTVGVICCRDGSKHSFRRLASAAWRGTRWWLSRPHTPTLPTRPAFSISLSLTIPECSSSQAQQIEGMGRICSMKGGAVALQGRYHTISALISAPSIVRIGQKVLPCTVPRCTMFGYLGG
jgi:hypothetical protein